MGRQRRLAVARNLLRWREGGFRGRASGGTLTFLSQPDAEYYTLLGTALASKTGPDVIWANGGAQAKNLIGGLIPLDDKLPDLISKLVGKSAFTGSDGKLYFIPTTLQGHVVYYNKKLYKDAGLDPNIPADHVGRSRTRCATP